MVDFNRVNNPVRQNIGNTSGTLKHRAPRSFNQPQQNPVTPLAIDHIVVLSSTSLHVFFNIPALNNRALRDPANYYTSPNIGILAVSPDTPVSTISLVLTTTEMLDTQAYTLNIDLVEAA